MDFHSGARSTRAAPCAWLRTDTTRPRPRYEWSTLSTAPQGVFLADYWAPRQEIADAPAFEDSIGHRRQRYVAQAGPIGLIHRLGSRHPRQSMTEAGHADCGRPASHRAHVAFAVRRPSDRPRCPHLGHSPVPRPDTARSPGSVDRLLWPAPPGPALAQSTDREEQFRIFVAARGTITPVVHCCSSSRGPPVLFARRRTVAPQSVLCTAREHPTSASGGVWPVMRRLIAPAMRVA